MEILDKRGVLVFRELGLTGEEQRAFAETLGEIGSQLGGRKVVDISLHKDSNGVMADYLKGSVYWHFDSATEDVPTRASLLTARRLSDVGGDTLFANMYGAYEALPEEDKEAIANLRAVHSIEASQLYVWPEATVAQLMEWRKLKGPSKAHPLVWTHRSGRKSLVLGASVSHVEGMGVEDGRLLLIRLREWATQPQFVYRHKWKLGDLVIWDNTGTMHRAEPYPLDSGRLMTRTSLKGVETLV
jgi:alpha-ketoglutarate-dependent taurine dioxygenase